MVRPMISRMCAAAFIVVLGLGLMLVPNESFGRGGGGGGFGRPGGFAGRSLPLVSSAHRSIPAPQVHLARPVEPAPLLHRRRGGFGLPYYGVGGFGAPLGTPDGYFPDAAYGAPAFSPPDYGDPYYRSSYADRYADPNGYTGSVPVRVNPYMVYRPGCRTQTVTVPSEDGEEREINIVRC
jgi:hypothetical protein